MTKETLGRNYSLPTKAETKPASLATSGAYTGDRRSSRLWWHGGGSSCRRRDLSWGVLPRFCSDPTVVREVVARFATGGSRAL